MVEISITKSGLGLESGPKLEKIQMTISEFENKFILYLKDTFNLTIIDSKVFLGTTIVGEVKMTEQL